MTTPLPRPLRSAQFAASQCVTSSPDPSFIGWRGTARPPTGGTEDETRGRTAMTAPFSARRRAEEFDALVSGASSATPRPPLTERDAERFADLLAVVDDLRAIPEVDPRPDVRRRPPRAADGSRPTPSCWPRRPRARAEEARLVLPARPRARDRRLATAARRGGPRSAPPPRWPWPPRPRCPASRSTPSSAPSRTPRPASPTTTPTGVALLLANARGRLDEVDELARTAAPRRSAGRRGHARHLRRAGRPRPPRSCSRRTPRPATSRSSPSSLRSFAGTSLDQPRRRSRDACRTPPATSWSPPARRSPRSTRGPAAACPTCGGERRDAARPSCSPPRARGLDVGSVRQLLDLLHRRPWPHRLSRPSRRPISGRTSAASRSPTSTTTVRRWHRWHRGRTPGGGTGERHDAGTEVPSTGTGDGRADVKGTVTGTVDEVTKLLTGDVPTLVDEVPVVGDRSWRGTLGGMVRRRGRHARRDDRLAARLSASAARVSGRRSRAPAAGCRASAGSSRAPGR